MTVRDQGRRPANLNLLQAPKLDRMPELESNFRVPREQLGGTVEGRSKVFTQTIRADNDSINEIPALPFTYFDPATETYETSWSRPVAISVSPTTGVSTQDVIGLSGAARAAPDSLKNVAGGILANYTGTHLLQDESSRPNIFWLLLLLAPPLAVIGTSTMHRRHTRLQGDTARTRARTAGRTAFARLSKFDDMSSISATLTAYVADRFDLHEGGLTRHDIAQRLSNANVGEELVDRIDQLLAACERHHFSGGETPTAPSLVVEAERCIRDLEGVPTPMKLMMTFMITVLAMQLNATAHAELTTAQRESILAEAQADYDTGTSMLKTNPAQAVTAFRTSAERFQLLVDEASATVNCSMTWAMLGIRPAILVGPSPATSVPNDSCPMIPRLEANLIWTRSLVRPQIATDDH